MSPCARRHGAHAEPAAADDQTDRDGVARRDKGRLHGKRDSGRGEEVHV
jgi:hypothetical protein